MLHENGKKSHYDWRFLHMLNILSNEVCTNNLKAVTHHVAHQIV